MKTCTRCREEKPESDFYSQRRASGPSVASICKTCIGASDAERLAAQSPEERAARLARMRELYLIRKYGITVAEYDAMFVAQSGVCKICGLPETAKDNKNDGAIRRLCVDHDHETGRVRGLLCLLCNTRLGYFEKLNLIHSLNAYLTPED